MTPADLLALSAERDAQLTLRHGYWREGHAVGWERGWKAGYEQAAADLETHWREMASRVARGANQPTFAELERRRWTVHGEPRTRETFAQPHPADYESRRP